MNRSWLKVFSVMLIVAVTIGAYAGVQTPGVAGRDSNLLILTVCGIGVALIETTPEGATAAWVGLHAKTRVEALTPAERSETLSTETGAQYDAIAVHCESIRRLERELKRQQERRVPA